MRTKGPSIAPDAPAASPAALPAGLMRPKGPVDTQDAAPSVLPIVSGLMRTKGGADAGDALAGAAPAPGMDGRMRPKGTAEASTVYPSDNLTIAPYPAADDFAVIDGVTNGTRKVHLGTAAIRDTPETGNASASQVVLGNDSRLIGGGGATALADLTDVDIPAPVNQEFLTFNNITGKWFSNPIMDGGNF